MASSKEQLLQSAEKFLAKGKLEPALKEYLRLLDENPKDVATLNRVGDLYVRMNRPAESIQYYTRIADSYSRDGFFLKAIAIFKKINKIDPARLDIYEKLADLYHKQGLTQDARSQYQVLADHYQKSGKHEDAIAAYKKMAGVDPSDLKIQVRLADLYRSHNQTEQAVMQYGLIGSMLLRRGAHDEAAAVFQKALELSPNDANIQKSLVRSLLAQKNAPAAIAILKAAPRTADSLALSRRGPARAGQQARCRQDRGAGHRSRRQTRGQPHAPLPHPPARGLLRPGVCGRRAGRRCRPGGEGLSQGNRAPRADSRGGARPPPVARTDGGGPRRRGQHRGGRVAAPGSGPRSRAEGRDGGRGLRTISARSSLSRETRRPSKRSGSLRLRAASRHRGRLRQRTRRARRLPPLASTRW